MTYGVAAPRDFGPFNRGRSSRKASSHTVSGAGALALSLVVGAWMLYDRPVEGPYVGHRTVEPAIVFVPHEQSVAVTTVSPESSSDTQIASAASLPAAADTASAANSADTADSPPAQSSLADSNGYVALLDPTYSLGSNAVSLAQSTPLQSHFVPEAGASAGTVVNPIAVLPPQRPAMPEIASNVPEQPASELTENAPLPPLRPVTLEPPESHLVAHAAPSRQLTRQAKEAINAEPPADHRSFFDKLFGSRTGTPGLAYASAEDGVASNGRSIATGTPGLYDRSAAIYDIAAHTVYLPNGTRLEAHSGLGGWLDDPHHVDAKMRGATPPAVYDLQLREKLFHGVQALRLIPVGSETVYGRTGLLAHTYMLGPNGQSNGCVSFRDYKAFLQAYQSGEIKRLVVVARLN